MKNTIVVNKKLGIKAGITCCICMLLTICNVSNAQSGYGFKDIPLVYNIDSMEAAIPKMNKQTVPYIKHLIVIENSRILLESYKGGEYQKEIDSLSSALQFPFGNAFAALLMAKNITLYSFIQIRNPILYCNKAIAIFSDLKDTAGLIYTRMQLANYHATNLRVSLKRNIVNSALEKKQQFEKRCRDSIQFNLSKALLAIKKTDTVSVVNLLNAKANIAYRIDTGKTALNKIGAQLDTAILLVENTQRLQFQLAGLYVSYGKVFKKNNNPVAALAYFIKALKWIPHKESILNYSAYYDIATTYYSIGKRDSSIRYHLLSLNTLEKDSVNDFSKIIDNHNALAAIYQEQKNYKAAYEQVILSNQYLKQNHNETLKSQIDNYEDNLKLETQKIQLQTEKAKKKQANQVMWIVIAMLGILGFVLANKIIANRKLRSAYIQIKSLQQSRDKFYSIVAHDLRSPIDSYQGMAGTVSYLLKTQQYSQIEKISQHIDNTGIRLQTMLQNLLSWSLSQEHQLAYQPVTLYLAATINEILPLYCEIAANKGVTFESNMDTAAAVNTDPNYLLTILRNMLDNAIKNAPGKTEVKLRVYCEANSFFVSVTNQAAIDPVRLETLQLLFAGNKPWQPGEMGMGMGMILARDFAATMQGRMEVHYTEGRITISLVLPI